MEKIDETNQMEEIKWSDLDPSFRKRAEIKKGELGQTHSGVKKNKTDWNYVKRDVSPLSDDQKQFLKQNKGGINHQGRYYPDDNEKQYLKNKK